ncbi:hypothetical protein OHA21_39360 [Actinoplanes sp. NBC_00393]|uniref:hypothetical protein n=1 Tax=Actinoplanes sp. NBC_00393 TaxID=2975953 RepID=UPI002E1AB1A5
MTEQPKPAPPGPASGPDGSRSPAPTATVPEKSGSSLPLSEVERSARFGQAAEKAPDDHPAAPKRRRRFGIFAARRSPSTTTPSPVSKPDTGAESAPAAPPAAPQQTRPAGALPRQRKALPTTRPPGAPPDPWTAFATIPEQSPGRVRRATRTVRRALVHEYALVIYAGSVLAVLMTWPTLRYPLHTLPQDLGDPARQAWQISWAGHILATDPIRLWHSNAYYPEALSFGFGDSLLGYAPFALVGDGPAAAVLRYNLLFVAAHALLAIGAYALVRQLGARPIGASVAAVAFAYAPWRLAQEGHLDVISAGAIPLALAMLARGHGYSMRYGFRPARRHAGWAAAGWAAATWQISLGFSLGVPFAYVLAIILIVLLVASVVHGVRHNGKTALHRFLRGKHDSLLGWRLVATDTLGATIFTGVALLIAVPYALVPDSSSRLQEIRFFSPPLRSLLIGPAESRIWGASHVVPRSTLGWAGEMSLLPGFALYALALAGLIFSVWRLRHRLLLFLGLVVAVVLTLGTTFFGGRWTYLPLFGSFPASFDLRIPGRLMLWVTLILAILAAGAVDDFVRRAEHLAAQRVPPWPGPWMRTAMLAPLVLVALEGWNATAHPVVPPQPAAMRTVTGPMLVLPTGELSDQMVQLWSTSRFESMANGGGTFAGARQNELRSKVASFPDQASIEYLRSIGVTTVVLLRNEVAGTRWERSGEIPVDGLGIQREDLPDAVVFRLRPATPSPQPSDPNAPPGQVPSPTVSTSLPSGLGTVPPGLGTVPPGLGTVPGLETVPPNLGTVTPTTPPGTLGTVTTGQQGSLGVGP